jgi:multiple antibiotic resistance protein
MPEVPLDKLFVLLFMMTGPLRVVPGFAALSRELDGVQRNSIATRGALYAAAGVLLAVLMGHVILASWGASPQALSAATGILLFLTALQSLIGWPVASQTSQDGHVTGPMRLALSPLAFPIILPPFAVGVLILFGAYFPDFYSKLMMLGLSLGLIAVDWIAMKYSQQIIEKIGASTLQVLGAVFGVLQLSLAIQMVFWAVKSAFMNP